MADDLKVGILGYGIGGRVFHAPLVAATPGLVPAVIVTSNPERAAQARAEYPGAEVIAGPDEFFARAGELDLVVVSTPNRTHAPLALRAIELGLPVVVDKPFAPTEEAASRVVAAAKDRGVGLTVFQNRRWDSDFLTVRKVVESGRLGEVFRFESRYDRWVPEVKDNWREFGDPAEAGGLLYDLGAHIVDQALQLFGPVAEVYAEADRRRPGVAVDDDVFVALHHANGVRSHLWASALAATRNPRFRLLGDRATFTKYGLDVQEPQIKDGLRPGDEGWGVEPAADAGVLGVAGRTETVATEAGRYQDFYAQVRDALHGEADFPVDPASAVATLRVIEAAHRSAAEGRVLGLG
ncbi:Gfo/Idh/MocA family oxidoreductase [Amycolatopsis sp. PS_44_ISF1]|uniref:Gfo/Idh/MocA family oxidoreductase n=1 Tax=Amycolatopsis sp. PS_44_ISF1 TaxID=2974917 RepID=UPI0028DF1C63|nr:Gfo/Idh/MocA family oxidoreductase [Amycolatopsis sp. PS_44_ISF1]MDT8910502.1 Gfo/Idh/MocA family oxidoreductase [Amycolatopsis sp. PS_44_ISF1]